METQKQVWDKIAPEWDKFKKPSEKTLSFVKKQKGKFLDIGCASGRYMVKKKDLEYHGIDFSSEMIKLAKKKAKKLGVKAELKVADASKIPYPNNFFDSALHEFTLHCISSKEKRAKTLRELFRVLKPGGIVRIAVWNKSSKRFRNKKKNDTIKWTVKGHRNYYFYEPEEFYKSIEKSGLKILSKSNPTSSIIVKTQKPISFSLS